MHLEYPESYSPEDKPFYGTAGGGIGAKLAGPVKAVSFVDVESFV